jgi:conjugal transfer pilus assembly protein TraB
MLNGADAPTGGQAQSNPLPIALHVLDTANLANKYKLDIRDCRFVAAAWGDLSSERMMGRTDTLTCIIGGETVEMQVKGQIIGEDGKAGVRGRLVTKQGQVLANALLAGIASGIGKAFQQSATTTSTSALGATSTIQPGDVGRAAIGSGVGNAGTALEQYYLKAADKLFPVIETDGGRTVEVLITKGAVYNGRAANIGNNYRGLLKRNGSNSRGYDDED